MAYTGRSWLIGERGGCNDAGHCHCFPPYRGNVCSKVDKPIPRRARVEDAVIWYLIRDTPKVTADLRVSLDMLWRHYNAESDYPVLVFHDGLAQAARRKILAASQNRLWFIHISQQEFWGTSAGGTPPVEPLLDKAG
eukprot:5334174-Amphidinium_carterae.1